MSHDISPGVMEILKEQEATCFLCRWILQDIAENGKLTGFPFDWGRTPVFPVDGKNRHIDLEVASNCPF